jgi:hypothetical protein
MFGGPTAKSTAKSGERRGLEGTQSRRYFMNLLISIGVCVGSNPTLAAKIKRDLHQPGPRLKCCSKV